MTWTIIMIAAGFLILFDIWTFKQKGADTTISWTLYSSARNYPVIPFALGLLMGHLFWVQHGG